MPDKLAGRTLGDFRLDELVGRGASGKVYRATQLSLRRTVAVKVLEEGLFTLPEMKDRFVREAEFIARLEHPNIIPVYAAGNEGNLYFFAMRFVEGATLAERMTQGMPVAEGIRYLADIAAALSYAHARGILHRDVKPANIMIADGAAVLADFGLARLLEQSTITASSAMLGTPLYRSPEAKPTFRSDLYALGVILYEIATGRHPYAPAGRDELVEKIRAGVYDPPADPAVAEVVARAMRMEYAAAGEMQRDLLALRVAGDVTIARPAESATTVEAKTVEPKTVQGKPFGKFLLQAKLGHGGMGIVYRAEQTDLGRVVALKVLQGDEDDEGMLQRFLGEARAAARLRHPNIVPIYEVGEIEDKRYFTMELVDGADLDRQSVAPKRAVEVVRDVARAIHYAHEQGIIHRDLKPANILLDRSGRALVTDFGLAKDLKADQKLTGSGEVFGTPAYMAPEQAQGRPTAASDVYALGAVLYHLLTGGPPHHGSSPVEIMMSVVGSEPIRPRSVNAKIHADIETMCLKAMEKDPARRYPSAGAFADDCERFLAGEPIVARPTSMVGRLWRRAVRHRAIVLPAALATLFLGVWLLVSTRLRSDRVDREAALGEQREREGAWKDAEAIYRGVIQVDPGHADANEGLRRVQAKLLEIANGETESSKLCEAGRAALESAMRRLDRREFDVAAFRDDVSKARALFEEAAAQAPHLPNPEYLRGRACELAGDDEAAEQAWRAAIARDPEFGPARYQLGRLLLIRSYLESIGPGDEPGGLDFSRSRALANAAEAELAAAVASKSGFDEERQREICGLFLLLLRRDLDRARKDALAAVGRHSDNADFCWLLGLAHPTPYDVPWFEKALERQPHHWLALLGLGIAHDIRGAWADAEAALTRALALRPRLGVAHNNRGVVRMRLRDLDGAFADLNRAVELDPLAARGYINRARVHSTKGDFEKALADLNRSVELGPDQYWGWVNRGVCHGDLGRHDLDVADQTRAIELAPSRAPAWHNRGAARIRLGQLDEAIADFTEAIRLQSDYVDAILGRSSARYLKREWAAAVEDCTRGLALGDRHFETYLRRGICRRELGDYAGALADFEEVVKLGGSKTVVEHRMLAHLGRGDFRSALVDADALIAEFPDSADAHYYRGWCLFELGRFEDAIDSLQACLSRKPDMARAYHTRGRCHDELDRHAEALEDYGRAIAIEKKPLYYLSRSISRFRKRDFRAAVDDATAALELDSKYVEALAKRGAARCELREFDLAIEDLSEALRLKPGYEEPRLFRARAYRGLNRIEDAKADLDRVLDANPRSVEGLIARIDVANLTRDFGGAIALADRLLAIDASSVDGWNGRGYARLQKQDYAGAIGDLSEAVRLKPDFPMARYFLAGARHDSADLEGAIAEMEELLKIAPKDWSARAKAERILDVWKKERK